jgi:hypothetical protein
MSRSVVAGLALVTLSVLACEAALQVAALTSRAVHGLLMPPWERTEAILPDPERLMRGNPYHPEHDAAGYRNVRRPRQADIVVLGDSHAYGAGVRREEAWPALLGAYNMALPSYGPAHSLLQLDEALALRPQRLIVSLYFGNDLADSFILTTRRPELLDGHAPDLRVAAEAAERRGDLGSEVMGILTMGAPGGSTASPPST